MITYKIKNPDGPYSDLIIHGEDFADAVIDYSSTANSRNGDKAGIEVTLDEQGGNSYYPLCAIAVIPWGNHSRRMVILGREERKLGRPRIGGEVLIRLGDDLLGQVDAHASECGQNRAEVIRALLGEALSAAQPYTVTIREISTGVREISSRHGSLGAAVEALREHQAYDNENNGLPSYQPRVEHDGRPVNVEAMTTGEPG